MAIAHIGREKTPSKPVYSELEKFLPIQWGGVIGGEHFNSRYELMSDGDFLLAENIRQDDRREKANDKDFAEQIAAYGEIYVNDAICKYSSATTLQCLHLQSLLWPPG